MNQILYTANGKAAGPLPIQVIAKFFAICIIVFGLIFFAQGTYNIFSVNIEQDVTIDTSVPQIEFAKDGNIATVSISHNKGINIIKYYWNDDEAKIVRGEYKKEVLINDLNLPSGVNILHVEATDENGRTATSSYEYSYDGIAIETDEIINNSDIRIVASDLSGMSYMTYKWNSGDEIKVYPDEEGAISISATTEIPSGLNTLYITAVNSSNITLSKTQKIKGNKRPEISFYINTNEMTFNVTVRDEEGVDKVVQQINSGEEQVYEANGKKEFTYSTPITDEHILVTITATDVEGVERTIRAKS